MSAHYPVYAVDDDPGICRFLSSLCQTQGWSVRCFENGELFLEALDRLAPGCVILDMRMPRLHGLQVQAEMRRRGRFWPVVAISGYSDVGMAVDTMRMGAVDFLEKPIDAETLLAAIAVAFRRLDEDVTP